MTTLALTASGQGSFMGSTYTAGTTVFGKATGGVSANAWQLFSAVTIPQGATINSASVAFTVTDSHSFSSGGVSASITGSDEDTVTAGPTTLTGFTGTPRTSASTPFTGALSGSITIDPSAIMQEIADRAGWASGSGFLLLFNETTTLNNHLITVAAGSLTVDYAPPVTGVTGTVAQTAPAATQAATGTFTPFTIEASSESGTDTITWAAHDDATAYVIERDGEIIASGVTDLTYTDTPGDGEHTYRVGVTR